MRIQETIERTGYFWLPGQEEKKIPGTLRIVDGGNITLEVVGNFSKNDDPLLAFESDDIDLKRIIGHLEKDGLVTLQDCFYRKKNFSFGGISKSEIVVNFAIIGVAYHEGGEILLDEFKFTIEYVDEWLQFRSFSTKYSEDFREVTVRYKRPEDIEFAISKDMSLAITFDLSVPASSFSEASIWHKPYFKLTSKKPLQPWKFFNISHKIVNFICFACDETVCITDVLAFSSLVMEKVADQERPAKMRVFYGAIPFTEKKVSLQRHRLLFSFKAIENNPAEVINAWLKAYEIIDPVMGLYFSSKAGSHKYMESRFLALAQAVETYHRRTTTDTLMDEEEFKKAVNEIEESVDQKYREWISKRLKYANEIPLNNRILFLIDQFGQYFGVKKARKKLCRRIVVTRNYLTHYDEKLAAESAKGRQLWILCLKMEVLLQMHLLKEIKFSEKQIDSVVKNSSKIRQALQQEVL